MYIMAYNDEYPSWTLWFSKVDMSSGDFIYMNFSIAVAMTEL